MVVLRDIRMLFDAEPLTATLYEPYSSTMADR
jgi:hypothetical protein